MGLGVCVCTHAWNKNVLIYKDTCGDQRLVKGLSFLVAALLYHFESVSVILARLVGSLVPGIHLSITSSPGHAITYPLGFQHVCLGYELYSH